MRRLLYLTMVSVLFSAFVVGGQAFGAPALYDDFAGTYIDSQKWSNRELVREVAGGKLVSKIGNDTSTDQARNNTPFQNPSSINIIQCDITVVATNLDGGTDPRSFARVDGRFYNTLNSGTEKGDVWAAVFIGDRGSGLEAWWEIIESLDDEGNSWADRGHDTLATGPLSYGIAYTAKIEYDKTNNQFTFTVAGVSSGPVLVPARQGAEFSAYKALETGVYSAGGSGTGYASAMFDNVYINNNPIGYDDFSTGALDQTKWRALEFVREISAGKLRLNAQADEAYGGAYVNSIYQTTAYLEAKVLVETGSEVSGATGRARLRGFYYNDSRGPGSGQDYNGRVGDVFGYTGIKLDDGPTLSAIAIILRCDDANCSTNTVVDSHDFATSISFDQEYTFSNEFTGSSLIFTCDGETYTYDITTPIYPPSTGQERRLESWVFAGPGQSGYVKANFDDVYVGAPGSISGQVTGPNGPIQGLWMQAYAGPCWNTWLGGGNTDEDGNYTIENLPSVNVYVRACAGCVHLNYVDEWYDANNGTTDCNAAAPVLVVSDQNTPGIDFDLERGPKRMQSFNATLYNGGLGVDFDIYPGFNSQLVSATVDLARGTQYEFDVVNDRFVWDSECRYLDMWSHDFGPVQSADYGDYTLTLVFSDGAQETEIFTLQEATVVPVKEGSISVTVNDDGSVHVSWDRQTTDTYNYQVRVRDDAGKEIYRAGSQLNINQMYIPAPDLGCLELGKTYRWLVRVYDLNNYRAETRETTKQYSPSAFTNRTSQVYAWAWNGKLSLGFAVRPGSRNNIDHVTVTGPNGFSYAFDLSADWFDISTETRLGMKGWSREFDLGPNSYGIYNFEIVFKDGPTENRQTTLNAVPVTPVDSTTMAAVIYADGAITFSWDLPDAVTARKYQMRIRSEDGSKEYYISPTQEDMATVTASFNDLRAMERGKTYQWFVRATDDYWGTMNTMEGSGSLTFLYDPFPTYNPGAAVFGPDSANITNTYIPMELGGRLTYTGTGALVGYGHYLAAVAVETVDSVSCMKVLVRGEGNHPDPDQDPNFLYAWVAQDNDGNVWILKDEEHEGAAVETYVFGRSGAVLFMPANPVVGQIIRQFGEPYTQVQNMGVTVPQLTTGLGPFTDCLKLVEVYGQWVDNIEYVAPTIGTVKEEWDIQWDPKGWELVTLPTGFPSVTTGLAIDITSSSAILNGTVNPNGLTATYYFEYGTSTGYGSTTEEADAGSGWDEVPVNAQITLSDPLATYHYRLVATNSVGTSYGEDKAFTDDTDADLMPDDWERNYFGDLSHAGTADTDDDDLTDLQEYQNGTIPTNRDTDSDEMHDGWEVTYGLDPLVDDADGDLDGDGVKNIDEYYAGSHPNNWEPDQPVLSSPVDGATGVSLTPTLETAAFYDEDGDSHATTDWQVSTDNVNFSDNLVFDVSCDTHLTSLTVPEFILTVSDVIPAYYWRARFHDDRDAASEWSEVSSFTNIDAAASDDTDQNGVPDEQEITDPNVDLDEDGNPDMTQGDMKCANTVVGDGQVAVKQGTNVSSVDSIRSIDPATIADTQNKPDEMPLGLISFRLTVDNPGDTAQVTVYLSEPAPSDAKWYKYDTVNGWQDYSAHAIFSADRRSVTLELQDGGYGDADGLANGTIIDPSGAGAVTAPAPPAPAPAGGGGGGGGCFIDTAGSEFRR
ncbi:MAG TPA: choice-of-anchor U domain-containing protein [Desulfatiglandales bacterium]|nr:choice-of-anchor U domain-containing protein [Desulfatiglandales bacterium]